MFALVILTSKSRACVWLGWMGGVATWCLAGGTLDYILLAVLLPVRTARVRRHRRRAATGGDRLMRRALRFLRMTLG